MDRLYDQTLANMEGLVHNLAWRVPPPQPVDVPFKVGGFHYRYVEKTIHQALVQKLARMVSSLHAARILLERGFLQEQGALQRMLDELQEDIHFLAYGVVLESPTPLYQQYLDAFYEEEFDAESPVESTQKRPMVPRKKIHAYLSRLEGANPNRGVKVARTISKTYSGYVHAASPHIMDMYGGDPPMFYVRGMLGTPRHRDHQHDLWNYFFRGLNACCVAAKAFGDDELFGRFYDSIREFQDLSGRSAV